MRIFKLLSCANLVVLVLTDIPLVLGKDIELQGKCSHAFLSIIANHQNEYIQKRDIEPLTAEQLDISCRLESLYSNLTATFSESGFDHYKFYDGQDHWDKILGDLGIKITKAKFEWAIFNQFVFTNRAFETFKICARHSSTVEHSDVQIKDHLSVYTSLNAKILSLYTSHGAPNVKLVYFKDRLLECISDVDAWKLIVSQEMAMSSKFLTVLAGEVFRAHEALEDLRKQLPADLTTYVSIEKKEIDNRA